MVAHIKEIYSHDLYSLAKIERADKYHNEVVKKYYIPFIAQSSRRPSPINGEDYIYAILSETPETISFILNTLPSDIRAQFRVELLKIMSEAAERGEIELGAEEKLRAISEH